ncbi:MAG: coproporphyrinogen III oxidase-like Fe-S oxidoreductase [Myxococcota bacterium]|jgi:coproporphyrinogen III oxidase-like Fe-S oxidoreductase
MVRVGGIAGVPAGLDETIFLDVDVAAIVAGMMPRLHPRWLSRRRRLHAAFLRACEPPDASWLAYLGRKRRTWETSEVADLWASSPRRNDAWNHVYIHVPFCKSICSFCNYDRLRPSHPDQLRAWTTHTVETIEGLASGLSGLEFVTLYVGGGTPSVLPAESIIRVVRALEAVVTFHPRANRFFEMDPAVMTPTKLAAWQSLGFSHVSFGVQSLDADINEAHNRGRQDRELVARRFTELRAAGMHDVSCDFLLGLAGTTVDGIMNDIATVLSSHRPRWIDVYQLTPTAEYVDAHFGGSREAFWEHLRPFAEQAGDRMEAIAEENGYKLIRGQDHRFTIQKDSITAADGPMQSHSPFSYSQLIADQQRPLSLLGLGPSARSRIFGEGWLTCEEPQGADGPFVFEGSRGTIADEAHCYLVHALRDGDRIDGPRFARIFGDSLAVLGGAGIAALVAEGLAELTEAGLVMKPTDRRQRTADLLWLVDERRIERELAHTLSFSMDASSLWRRLHPLRPGTRMGTLTLEGVTDAAIQLRGEDGPIHLRVCPPLSKEEGPGLVVESGIPSSAGQRRALTSVVRLLSRTMA